MDIAFDYTTVSQSRKTVTWFGKIKLLLSKLIRATRMDVDALVESKDWPYLWRR